MQEEEGRDETDKRDRNQALRGTVLRADNYVLILTPSLLPATCLGCGDTREDGKEVVRERGCKGEGDGRDEWKRS